MNLEPPLDPPDDTPEASIELDNFDADPPEADPDADDFAAEQYFGGFSEHLERTKYS